MHPPSHRGFERRIELGQRHFGEKAEAAEVHAENRNRRPRLANPIGHRQERAVAAKDEDQIDSVDEGALVGHAAIRCRRHQSGSRRLEYRRETPRLEPRRNLREVRCRLAQVGLRHDADARYRGRHERIMN